MPYKNKEDKKKRNREYYLKNYNKIRSRQKEIFDSEDNKLRCKKWRSIKKSNNILFKDILEYKYSKEECDREFELLLKKPGDIKSKQQSNKIVLTNQPHFYEIEKKIWEENSDGIRQWIVDNRKQYINKDEYQLTDREVLRAFKISGKYIGFSHFNPLWTKWFIEQYNINRIYDPCGGWGHRLLGAVNIDQYIYNDFDPRTVEGCKRIANTYNINNTIFYNEDSSNFIPKESYDCVFTCPPYYNVETYNNKMFKNNEDYKNWWNNTIKCSVKDDVKWFSYIINHTYYNVLRECCESNGLVLENTFKVGNAYNHFSRAKKDEPKKMEFLVVFSVGF